MKRVVLAACALCAFATHSPAARRTALAPDRARESWFIVRIGDAPVGTASELWSNESGATVFRARMNVNFTRLGTPLALNIAAEETCDTTGVFRSASIESSVSNLRASAVLEGDSIRYQSSTGGIARRRTLAWDPSATSEMRGRERVRAWLAGGAPEITLTMFDAADGGFHRQRLVRAGSERRTVAGKERDLIVVHEFDDDAESSTATIWYARDGEELRMVLRQLGVEIVIERVTAEELASLELESSFDIIRHSMVHCEGFPSPASRLERVTLSLDFVSAPPRAPMNGPNQVEASRGAKAVRLTLTRETAQRMVAERAELDEYLRADRFVQSDDATLRAVADSLRAATGTEGWPLARAIATFVNRHIVDKGMEHGYDSALAVYRSRAGDCTEHALLTVALLRAVGIPARPAVGLAYGAAEEAFVGHMWVEAYVDYWRTLDALDPALDPIRIRVHAPRSSGEFGERDLMRAYGEVAGVTIRVVDHRPN